MTPTDPSPAPMRLCHLTIGYGQRTLLADANAEFPAASLTALIGRNGTGKSTLLRVMAGLERPQGGSVELLGHDMAGLLPPEKARLVAFVATSRVRVANMRCRDLVAMGRAPYTNWLGTLSADDRQAIDSALEMTDTAAMAHRRIDSLSDGECQRVMIARALAQNTPVILLDEPTSFLDIPNRLQLCRLLRSLALHQRKTIIFSTHELQLALDTCTHVGLLAPNATSGATTGATSGATTGASTLLMLPAAEMAVSPALARAFSLPD